MRKSFLFLIQPQQSQLSGSASDLSPYHILPSRGSTPSSLPKILGLLHELSCPRTLLLLKIYESVFWLSFLLSPKKIMAAPPVVAVDMVGGPGHNLHQLLYKALVLDAVVAFAIVVGLILD